MKSLAWALIVSVPTYYLLRFLVGFYLGAREELRKLHDRMPANDNKPRDPDDDTPAAA